MRIVPLARRESKEILTERENYCKRRTHRTTAGTINRLPNFTEAFLVIRPEIQMLQKVRCCSLTPLKERRRNEVCVRRQIGNTEA
jgi:hypothetical protein